MTILMSESLAFALELRQVDDASPARARHWVAWVLEEAGIPAGTVADVVLVVDELVTNAVVHAAPSRVLVSVQHVAGGVRLVVHDNAPAVGDWAEAGGTWDERGRGLILVHALTTDLSISRRVDGTTVEAVVPLPEPKDQS
jgi:anti-sigma regulatory factor (Ser/Thr protein kinase)